MDLNYFRQVAPVTDDILNIVIAVGWALLLGNLVFQATKSMVTGLGFEGEDPKLLFTRTFVFGFLLLASQQICDIGLSISSRVIALLQIPTSVTITIPDESNFNIGASWLLIIIVGFVIMWQFVKLCFEVAERYVVTAILVLMAPLAFGMGGSKNTEDIFKGWCRMFGSMCVMMILNVVFLKLLISALGYVPSGVAVLPWMLLIVGIARVARKIDGIVARMGLNPAITGDGLGRGLPGMVAYAVVKGIGSSIVKAAGTSAGSKNAAGRISGNGASGPRTNPHAPGSPPPPPPGGGPTGPGTESGSASAGRQGGASQGSSATRENSYAAQQQETIHATGTPGGEAHTGGAGDTVRSEPGAGRADVIHSQGTRRSSVPPEARGRKGAGRGRYTAAYTDTVGRENVPFGGGAAGTDPAGANTEPQRPPLHRTHDPAQSGRPGETAPPSSGGTRISAVAAGGSQNGSPERTSHTATHQTTQERASLQRDRTPKIPTPPGVGGGKGDTPTSPTPEMRPAAGVSTPSPDTAVSQAPAGERQTRRSSAAAAGTGGTPPASTGGAHRTDTPASGTAGTHTAYREEHTHTRRTTATTDTAGSGTFPGHITRTGHTAPVSGTAGTVPSPSFEQPLAGGAEAPSATAGMRRSAVGGTSKTRKSTPASGTAGTAPPPGSTGAGTNRGTRRLKNDTVPPFAGGKGRPPQSRKKRGEP